MGNGGFDIFAQARDGIGDGMEKLSFMKCLWEIFRGILWGVLDRLAERFGADIMEEIKRVKRVKRIAAASST